MPEKFRVLGAEGKLDEAASARKLADSYKALEAHKGAMPNVPATPEEYTLDLGKNEDGTPKYEQAVIDEFIADPLFKGFAGDLHALGASNEIVSAVVGRYLGLLPELMAESAKLTEAEASAELSTLWKDEATFKGNLSAAFRAVQGFAGEAAEMPGSTARVMDKFGNDPDFLAFAARIGAEMKEDRPAGGDGTLAAEADIESLQKSEAYWKPAHPDHAKTKAKVDAFYLAKHGDKKR